MTVHHLNCGTLCPYGGRLVSGEGGLIGGAEMVCHCLLIEAGDSLVLVDTGFGADDVAPPAPPARRRRSPSAFRPQPKPARRRRSRGSAGSGFDPADVATSSAPTSTSTTPAGCPTSPTPRSTCSRPSAPAAVHPSLPTAPATRPPTSPTGRTGSSPRVDGDSWFGFESIRVLPGVDPEIAADPAGRALRRPQRDRGPRRRRLGAALRRRLLPPRPDGRPAGLPARPCARSRRRWPPTARPAAATSERLCAARPRQHGDEVRMFCAHDPVELERMRGVSARRDRGAVVVTGSSTGIGRACAPAPRPRRLHGLRRRPQGRGRRGAARRTPPSGSSRCSSTSPTRRRSRPPPSGCARRRGGRLAGLVNNAGVVVAGPVEAHPLDELRRQLEVNVIGQVAVTQALLAMVRAARGRVVFMSSIGGRGGLPFLSAYNASKAAIERRRRLAAPGDEAVRRRGLDRRAGRDRDRDLGQGDRGRGAGDAATSLGAGLVELYGERARADAGAGGEDRLPRPAARDGRRGGRARAHRREPKARYPSASTPRSSASLARCCPQPAFDRVVERELENA